VQKGYREHPQNWPPAFLPRRAVRRRMGEPQRGQLSEPLDDVALVWVEADGAAGGGFWAIVIGVLAGTGKPRSLRL
jgi:hypothetical protein